jgi:hypothetical protein
MSFHPEAGGLAGSGAAASETAFVGSIISLIIRDKSLEIIDKSLKYIILPHSETKTSGGSL